MASTILLGTNLKPFSEEDDINCFLERLEQYFEANNVAKERQVPTLLISLNEKCYKTLKNLCQPSLPKEKTFIELQQLLTLRYQPRVSYFRKRIIFDKLHQGDGETISKWYARVRESAAECNYGVDIEKRVTDKFVTGLKAGPILERLCEEPITKSVRELLDIALNKESAMMDRGHQGINKISSYVPRKVQYKGSSHSFKKDKVTPHSSEDKKCDLKCVHCGKGNHSFSKCKYKTYSCKICHKVGHLASICREKQNSNVNFVNNSIEILNINSLNFISPFILKCHINNIAVNMELDTGAAVSCIPDNLYYKKFSHVKLQNMHLQLKTYNGQVLNILGKIKVDIKYNHRVINGFIVVIKNGVKSLIGRDLIKKFNLQISKCLINNIDSNLNLESILQQFSDLFKSELGAIKNERIKLELKEANVKPIFIKPRPIPYAFKDKVNAELKKLEADGVITKTENSNWGTPLVPVLRENGSLRLCANYKITINKYLKDVNHPLPRIDDIFTALQGGEKFSKLDLRNAFNQLILDENTSELLAWSTPMGIYKVNRLPYGTKPASAIFQAKMEKILLGTKGIVNFIDDILVTGSNDIEHLNNLKEVMKRFRENGIRLNKSKCLFFQKEINYLGHIISKEGLKKDRSRLDAIFKMPHPKDVSEVRSWIGMVNYYSKFIPNLSIKLKPVYDLLQKNVNFIWSKECDKSFEIIKRDIISDNILIHFNRKLPIRLACDASQNGIGAVLSHILPNGSDRPITFISRVYSKAEKNYSMIHKEALAIYWAVQKFYQYLVGTKFELLSDHKPLQALFGENKSLPEMAAGRLQRWSIFLAGFDYTFKHIKGQENVKADCMSRLPLKDNILEDNNMKEYDYINFVQDQKVIDLNMVRYETKKDSNLCSIFNMIRYGFSDVLKDDSLKPYWNRKDELYIEQGVIMWGYRVVIPIKLRSKLLLELHATHEGIIKMKNNARSYFWWPNLDKNIESYVKNCDICMSARPEPNKSKIISWPKTNEPYERVHADFLGPIQGKTILLIVDSFSKWPEAFIMNNFESRLAIEKFRECFSRYGLPKFVVTDNASTFISTEFSNFLCSNGIKHETSPPFHPATNGLAENAVKNFKSGLYKAIKDKRNMYTTFETLMNRYLFHYRNSIHCTTNKSPSELLFKRKLRTRLDLLAYKNVKETVDKRKREEIFKRGDLVYCRDYRNPNKKQFVKCEIDETLGNRTYFCKVLNEDLMWKRHLDQMYGVMPRDGNTTVMEMPKNGNSCVVENNVIDCPTVETEIEKVVNEPQVDLNKDCNVNEPQVDFNKDCNDNEPQVDLNKNCNTDLRRSSRTIRAPERLNL